MTHPTLAGRHPTPGWRSVPILGLLVSAAFALPAVFTAAPALALPEGRVYEMVSPLFKGGYGVTTLNSASSDGERVAFSSLGGFAELLSASGSGGNFYLAAREATGWKTTSTQPPIGNNEDYSADLRLALATGLFAANSGLEQYASNENAQLLHDTDTPETAGNWEVAGGILLKQLNEKPTLPIEEDASPDLCHIIIGLVEPLLEVALNTVGQLYDLARGCGEESSLKLVALNNQGTPITHTCQVELGLGGILASSSGEQTSDINAVADGGHELLFTTNGAEGTSCPTHLQVFARLGGSRTLEISKGLEEPEACAANPCGPAASQRASAYFKGASEDGSLVYFSTSQPLVAEDHDQTSDLYVARIACPGGESEECAPAEKEVTALTDVSHDPVSGEAAEVQGVFALAPDGKRVYYVAHGVLTDQANAQGQVPTEGAENMYVEDIDSGETHFVLDLCSGPAKSGAVEDTQCPSDLTEGKSGRNDRGFLSGSPEVQTAGPQGRFLLFSTYAQALPSDTDVTQDVYRFDAETGALDRVSLGETGFDANGNDNGFDAEISRTPLNTSFVLQQNQRSSRAISEDGSRVIFASAAPLSPHAANHLSNIYEWHEGSVSLISGGSAEEADRNPIISPSGRDVFFQTVQGLVPQDTDGLSDVYDARLGGGFAPRPAPREECSADSCQGTLSSAPPLLVPGSVAQPPGENLPGPATPTPARPAVAPPRKCPKEKHLRRGGCVRVKVKKKPDARAKKAAEHAKQSHGRAR